MQPQLPLLRHTLAVGAADATRKVATCDAGCSYCSFDKFSLSALPRLKAMGVPPTHISMSHNNMHSVLQVSVARRTCRHCAHRCHICAGTGLTPAI